jgi:hypothetical protein
MLQLMLVNTTITFQYMYEVCSRAGNKRLFRQARLTPDCIERKRLLHLLRLFGFLSAAPRDSRTEFNFPKAAMD